MVNQTGNDIINQPSRNTDEKERLFNGLIDPNIDKILKKYKEDLSNSDELLKKYREEMSKSNASLLKIKEIIKAKDALNSNFDDCNKNTNFK